MDRAAAVPLWSRQHYVYGLKLRPWCLLSSLRLEALGNPWGSVGIADPHNTWVAAQVCAAGIGPLIIKPLGLIRAVAFDYRRQHKAMLCYIEDHETAPEYWDGSDDNSEPPETPWQYRMAVWAMETLHLDRETVWTMPMGELFWLRGAQQERAATIAGHPTPIYGEHAKARADLLDSL